MSFSISNSNFTLKMPSWYTSWADFKRDRYSFMVFPFGVVTISATFRNPASSSSWIFRQHAAIGMSYLSLISCTDLDVLCVAIKMRSAYLSVSKRESSFSRIGLDSVGIVIRLSIRFSDLILADRERCARFAEDFPPHTIGRSSAFGKPPDQSHERLNNSVYGFCP